MSLLALLGWTSDRPARQNIVLHTDRLLLRQPRLEDQENWSALRRNSRKFLQPWEPHWPADHLTRDAFKRRVRWAASEARADRAYSFLLFRQDSKELIGGLTISNIRRGPSRSASLGYWIGEPYAQQGNMRAAVKRATDFVFDDLGLVRLEAACLEANVASRALLESCGFKPEGVVRGYLEVNGAIRDHVLYSRLASDREAES